jgi:hypothetical protein
MGCIGSCSGWLNRLVYLAICYQNMTPELQKYYDDRFDLFSKPGWIDLMEDVDNVINSINNVSNVQDEKDLQFKKGELSILIWLKNLKQVSERAYEDL